jgi:hypothetical protein
MNPYKAQSPLLSLLVILTMFLSVNCLEAQQKKLITAEDWILDGIPYQEQQRRLKKGGQ